MNTSNINSPQSINIQTLCVLIYMISNVISLYILNSQKNNFDNNKYISSQTEKLQIINRFIIFGISIVFLYLTYINYLEEKDNENYNTLLKMLASGMIVVAAFIYLYFSITECDFDITEI